MAQYHSTRALAPTYTAKQAIRRGIAADGGLFVSDELGDTAIDIETLADKDYFELAREVLGILQKLHRQGNTVVLITHDNSIAMQAPRIIRLEDGRVVYDGDAHSPEAVVHPNYASEEAEGQEEQQQEGSV